jgi:hypothetical protein
VLIDTLKQQHKELILYIRQVDVLLARGDEPRVRTALPALSLALRAHLALEVQRLYPGLLRAAEALRSELIQETVKLFAGNMRCITARLQDLLDRHEDRFHLEQFQAGWSHLTAVLAERFESTERTLYPLYELRVLGVPASELFA